ncbi:SPOR domain-containing protein [Frigidibacter sp. MR17.14]|uniref:SPOR domain-containing protein n=1 Tax=Frigidibacter sp. MR17.14 TaxID=3126509 RepID=UPI003012FD7B
MYDFKAARPAPVPALARDRRGIRGLWLAVPVIALAGCQGTLPFGRGAGGGDAGPSAGATSVKLVDNDVEAPEVFQATDQGLWDGRPSLGGVWVAHPDVKDPERVIIRNTATDAFVIGALFRRERDMPGPKIQVSSDAAGALGMLAGQPASLQVTALRREEAPATAAAATTTAPATAAPAAAAPGAAAKPAAKPATKPAAAAPSAGPAAAASTAASAAAKPATAATPAPPATAAPAAAGEKIQRTFVQMGIFSVEANAETAAKQIKATGLSAEVRKSESQGKSFWRVLAGPFTTTAERDAAIAKVKSLGYRDAYAVKP